MSTSSLIIQLTLTVESVCRMVGLWQDACQTVCPCAFANETGWDPNMQDAGMTGRRQEVRRQVELRSLDHAPRSCQKDSATN